MVDVSIGVASACIAAVITVLQFLLPNALALILSGQVAETHSAVTWSVVSRNILTSDWPLFLRSDHAASRAVSRKIAFLVWIKPVGLSLIAIAAIITPLGLYEQVGPAASPQAVQFVYVADDSVIGAGTPARSNRGFNFSRSCADKRTPFDQLCPGDPYLGNTTRVEPIFYGSNETEVNSYYILSPSIAPSLIDLYQSGLKDASPSLSSFFDVQYRQWSIFSDDTVQNNGTLLTRAFNYLSTILMDNKYELFEGIIADTKSGGVGFRNHSVPALMSAYGTEWEEDILWMQPEASCINTNLTSVLVASLDATLDLQGTLVDRGGFTNIEKVRPFPNDTYPFVDGQNHPMLYERAHWLAWNLNALVMEYLNITDPGTNRARISSSLGQKFAVNSTLTTFTKHGTTYLDMVRGVTFRDLIAELPTSYNWNISANKYNYDQNPQIPNPYNITDDDISSAVTWYKGYAGGDKINISTIAVQMGYIMGPPLMLDQSNPDNASSIATYERPLYICSSATKASVKTIRFRYNSTSVNNLRNLEIMDMRDKEYERDDLKPLWGFETPWANSTTTWNISGLNPLWGIVDQAALNNHNVSTLRSDHFYIPAGASSNDEAGYNTAYSSYYDDYLAGTIAPPDNWAQTFSSNNFQGDALQLSFFQELTKNATGVEKLVKLMWTDYASNFMAGTRGLHVAKYKPMLSSSTAQKRSSDVVSFTSVDTSNLAEGQYEVYVLERQIRYRWVFGIPALICVGIVGLVVLFALIGMVLGNATIYQLRNLMYNISTGRVFASFVYPELNHAKSADTKQWIESVGHKEIHVYGRASAVERRSWTELKGQRNYVKIVQKEDFDTTSPHLR